MRGSITCFLYYGVYYEHVRSHNLVKFLLKNYRGKSHCLPRYFQEYRSKRPVDPVGSAPIVGCAGAANGSVFIPPFSSSHSHVLSYFNASTCHYHGISMGSVGILIFTSPTSSHYL